MYPKALPARESRHDERGAAPPGHSAQKQRTVLNQVENTLWSVATTLRMIAPLWATHTPPKSQTQAKIADTDTYTVAGRTTLIQAKTVSSSTHFQIGNYRAALERLWGELAIKNPSLAGSGHESGGPHVRVEHTRDRHDVLRRQFNDVFTGAFFVATSSCGLTGTLCLIP
jgi:hypothetical protein